jgi:hypothetical protein
LSADGDAAPKKLLAAPAGSYHQLQCQINKGHLLNL